MDIYELEVKNLLEEGGNERLKSQFMNLSIRLDKVSNENKELKKQISELESELTKKETLLKMREEFCEECKEKSIIEKLKATPLIEEPLPFSSDEHEEETKTELPTMPIDVASMLINATAEYPTNSFQKAFGAGETSFADKYSKSDLREIAEHLLVYCNNSDEDSDTQS